MLKQTPKRNRVKPCPRPWLRHTTICFANFQRIYARIFWSHFLTISCHSHIPAILTVVNWCMEIPKSIQDQHVFRHRPLFLSALFILGPRPNNPHPRLFASHGRMVSWVHLTNCRLTVFCSTGSFGRNVRLSSQIHPTEMYLFILSSRFWTLNLAIWIPARLGLAVAPAGLLVGMFNEGPRLSLHKYPPPVSWCCTVVTKLS